MNLKRLLFYLLGTIIIISPAIYNGYPLVYSDTGTYILSGMELSVPVDRPILYGLFILVFSLKATLWPVLLAQGLIAFYVLHHISRLINDKISNGYFLAITALLTWFSGIGWYTSQLMPDIFTFTAIATSILLAYKYRNTLTQNILFTLILLFSIGVHSSNVFIVALLIIGMWWMRRKNKAISITLPLLSSILMVLTLSFINYKDSGTNSISKGGHVFLMGKMLDAGVLKSYLEDNCEGNNYTLCEYKDNLPKDSRDLLWGSKSPINKYGGWVECKDEFTPVLKGILTSPKHLAMYGYNCVTSSATQLLQNDIGSGLATDWYARPESPVYPQIEKYYTFEFNQYLQSRQNKNLWLQGLSFVVISTLANYILFFSALILALWLYTKRKELTPELRTTIYLLVWGVIANAIVTASLANVYDRLQARVSWIIVFVVLLTFSKWREVFSKK